MSGKRASGASLDPKHQEFLRDQLGFALRVGYLTAFTIAEMKTTHWTVKRSNTTISRRVILEHPILQVARDGESVETVRVMSVGRTADTEREATLRAMDAVLRWVASRINGLGQLADKETDATIRARWLLLRHAHQEHEKALRELRARIETIPQPEAPTP